MPRHTTIYLRGALVRDGEEGSETFRLGFNGDAATCLDFGPDAHVYVDQGGALVVDTVPLGGPSGGYGHRQTFPAWRVVEVVEMNTP